MEIKENISYNKRIEKAQDNMLKRFDFYDTLKYWEYAVDKIEQRTGRQTFQE